MSLQSELGTDACELVQLYEGDLRRHEEAISEHKRTALTIRGFAITAVAALVAATYASKRWEPAAIGAVATVYFAYLDYYNSRLYVKVEQRIPLLESIAQSYRKLGSASLSRRRREVPKLKSYLRSYSPYAVIPRRPELRAELTSWLSGIKRRRSQNSKAKGRGQPPTRQQRSRGRSSDSFVQFAGLYVLLVMVAALSAFNRVEDNEEIVICQSPSYEFRAFAGGSAAHGCLKPASISAKTGQGATQEGSTGPGPARPPGSAPPNRPRRGSP